MTLIQKWRTFVWNWSSFFKFRWFVCINKKERNETKNEDWQYSTIIFASYWSSKDWKILKEAWNFYIPYRLKYKTLGSETTDNEKWRKTFSVPSGKKGHAPYRKYTLLNIFFITIIVCLHCCRFFFMCVYLCVIWEIPLGSYDIPFSIGINGIKTINILFTAFILYT